MRAMSGSRSPRTLWWIIPESEATQGYTANANPSATGEAREAGFHPWQALAEGRPNATQPEPTDTAQGADHTRSEEIMSHKRLNDTAALAKALPDTPGTEGHSHSVEIRKIDNGYVCRSSTCGPMGYRSSEEYYAEKPTLESLGLRGSEVGSSSMADAVASIRRGSSR